VKTLPGSIKEHEGSDHLRNRNTEYLGESGGESRRALRADTKDDERYCRARKNTRARSYYSGFRAVRLRYAELCMVSPAASRRAWPFPCILCICPVIDGCVNFSGARYRYRAQGYLHRLEDYARPQVRARASHFPRADKSAANGGCCSDAESTTWLDQLSLFGHSREQASRSTPRDRYLPCEESEDREGNAVAAIHQGPGPCFAARSRRCLITLGDYRYSTQDLPAANIPRARVNARLASAFRFRDRDGDGTRLGTRAICAGRQRDHSPSHLSGHYRKVETLSPAVIRPRRR